MLRTCLVLSPLVLLAACDNTPSTPPPPASTPAQASGGQSAEQAPANVVLPSIGPKATTAQKAEIDWASARTDLAANSDGTVSIQSAGDPPAEVPVLLPTGIVTSQSADGGPVYRRTDDGYFAFYPGPAYNIIVNGTNQTVQAENIPKTNPERVPVFSSTVAGAQVWLTRYGADYTVEFECNALESEDSSCIEESAAMEIANNLIVSGSR